MQHLQPNLKGLNFHKLLCCQYILFHLTLSLHGAFCFSLLVFKMYVIYFIWTYLNWLKNRSTSYSLSARMLRSRLQQNTANHICSVCVFLGGSAKTTGQQGVTVIKETALQLKDAAFGPLRRQASVSSSVSERDNGRPTHSRETCTHSLWSFYHGLANITEMNTMDTNNAVITFARNKFWGLHDGRKDWTSWWWMYRPIPAWAPHLYHPLCFFQSKPAQIAVLWWENIFLSTNVWPNIAKYLQRCAKQSALETNNPDSVGGEIMNGVKRRVREKRATVAR